MIRIYCILLSVLMLQGCGPSDQGDETSNNADVSKYFGFGYAHDYETFAFIEFDYSDRYLSNFIMNGESTSLSAFKLLGDSYLTKLQSNEGVYYMAKTSEGHGYLMSNWQFWAFDTVKTEDSEFQFGDIEGTWFGAAQFYSPSLDEPISTAVDIICGPLECFISSAKSIFEETLLLDTYFDRYGMYVLVGKETTSVANFFVTGKRDRMAFEVNCSSGFQNGPCIAGWLYKNS